MLRNTILCFALFLVEVARLSAAAGFAPRLNAVSLSSLQARQGDAITAAYEFINLGGAAADEDLTVFMHVRPAAPGDPDVPPMTGADFRPTTPTFAWTPGTVINEVNHSIRIPKDFPPGQYRLFIGLYNPGGGGQFKLANPELAAGRRYRVATLEVRPATGTLVAKPWAMRWHAANSGVTGTNLVQPAANEPAVWFGEGDLKVRVSAAWPMVLGYEWKRGGTLGLLGDSTGYPMRARLWREASHDSRTVILRPDSVSKTTRLPSGIRYSVQVGERGKMAAGFDVVLQCTQNVLTVAIDQVREEAGFQLMDVWLPEVVSARGTNAQLVLPTQAGRLVHVDDSAPGRHVITMNWQETDLCGAVVGEALAAAIRTRDWDSELEARVSGMPGSLAGGFAPHFMLRANASAPGARIKLAEKASFEVGVVGPGRGTAGTPKVSWVDAAKWLRRDLAGQPNPLYEDTFLYKIFCDTPGAKEFTTFDEALGVIRKVHQLAPWVKQVVYLVGWQYRGHDTGYPATDQINARLGGLEALRRVAAEAGKYNAILSYHDNFDDAYRESPRWDESVIARDAAGALQKGGVWAGGQSYILAFKKYAEKAAPARVQQTFGQMPVRGSYHIDVLSAVPLRRDFNASAPENSLESLQGKWAIIDEFRRRGVDVTSEGFTAPFIGRIGHGWHLWGNDETVFKGDESVPFIPMIYHGGPTTYGRGKRTASYAQENALCGASFAGDWTKRTSSETMAETLYLVVAPWTYLRGRLMQDYERRGPVARVTYSTDTFVEVNDKNGDWRVVVDGTSVVENGLAIVAKAGRLAVYSRTERRVTIPLPAALRSKPLTIKNAATAEDLTGNATVSGQQIQMNLPAKQPVLIGPQGEQN